MALDIQGWMMEVGAGIDPLVNKHHDRIAVMVERWAKKQQQIGPLGTDGPLPFREDRKLTIEDMYAIVAAIHQVTMLGLGGKSGDDQSAFDHNEVTGDIKVCPENQTFLRFLSHARDPYTLSQDHANILKSCVQRVVNDIQNNKKGTRPNKNVIDEQKAKELIARQIGLRFKDLGAKDERFREIKIACYQLSKEGYTDDQILEYINENYCANWQDTGPVRKHRCDVNKWLKQASRS